MSKRFTDTEKWKKGLIRGFIGAYKLLWLYICDDCNHAGIWEVEFEVAQIRVGKDMPVNEKEALQAFKNKIVPFDNGEKWFIPTFIEFQYGELDENNRAHRSVILILKRYNLFKGLIRPLQGRKDKDMDKDKDKALKKKEIEDMFTSTIGELFKRLPQTAWSEKEKKKMHDILKRPDINTEFKLICWYYRLKIDTEDYRRHDLQTMLNNWSGELDRARKWKSEHRETETETDMDRAAASKKRFDEASGLSK